jgi:hypothetical protein
LQCEPRKSEERDELLQRISYQTARAENTIVASRKEYKRAGFQAFIEPVLEKQEFAAILGPFARVGLGMRVPTDELHLVRYPVKL